MPQLAARMRCFLILVAGMFPAQSGPRGWRAVIGALKSHKVAETHHIEIMSIRDTCRLGRFLFEPITVRHVRMADPDDAEHFIVLDVDTQHQPSSGTERLRKGSLDGARPPIDLSALELRTFGYSVVALHAAYAHSARG